MTWIVGYLIFGVLVLVGLTYAMDCERPPRGWWHDRWFLLAAAVMVSLWPGIVFIWLRNQLR